MFRSGIGSLACARIDNLHTLWGLLVLAGLGIGGIVVPASIITTIICPDVSEFPTLRSRMRSLFCFMQAFQVCFPLSTANLIGL